MDFWTADLHFGHKRILEFTARSSIWSDIDAHDRGLIELINAQVTPKDDLYILGDLSFMDSPWLLMHALSLLKCQRLHLVLGNHDYQFTEAYLRSGMFRTVQHQLEKVVNVEGQRQLLVMNHCPMLQWNKGHSKYPAWMLHGHAHGDLDYSMFNMQDYPIMDVGIDAAYKLFGVHRLFTFQDLQNELCDRKPFPRNNRDSREHQ